MSSKITLLTTKTDVGMDSPIPLVDIHDTSMASSGTDKKSALSAASYSPATKVVAPSGSGFAADYYTDGTADDVQINAALAAINTAGGGRLILFPGYTYTVSVPLLIYSNTEIFAYGATITQAANTLCPLLVDIWHWQNTYGHAGLTKADNIKLYGGIWDKALGGKSNGVDGHTIVLGGVNLHVKDLEFRSTGAINAGFAMFFSNCTDFTIDNIFANNIYADLLDINGPATRGVISNFRGQAGDDMIDLCPIGPIANTRPGDITNITIDGVYCNDCQTNAVRLLGGVDVVNGITYNLKRIRVRNLSGSLATRGPSGIWVGVDNASSTTVAKTAGNIDEIDIDGVSLQVLDNTKDIIIIEGGSGAPIIPNVLIRNVTVSSDCHSVISSYGANISKLFINCIKGSTATIGTFGLIAQQASVISGVTTLPTIGNLTVDNIDFTSTGSQTGSIFQNTTTSASLTNCFLSNIFGANFSKLSDTASGTNWFLSNIRLLNNGEIFHFRNGASVIRGCTGLYTTLTSSSIIGSATLEVLSLTFPIDITDTRLVINKGNMAYNTNSSAVSGIGPVAYDGIIWIPMDSLSFKRTFAFMGA